VFLFLPLGEKSMNIVDSKTKAARVAAWMDARQLNPGPSLEN